MLQNIYSLALDEKVLKSENNIKKSLELIVKELKNEIQIEKNNFNSFKKNFIGIIVTASAQIVEKYFDQHGKGFENFTGWYVCNGNHSTPDLRGRFLVGFDVNNKEYSAIGSTGGLDKSELSLENLPAHSHLDKGHAHDIDLSSSDSGYHSHSWLY